MCGITVQDQLVKYFSVFYMYTQFNVNINICKYNRLSLFRLRLSQITAYLEEKILSSFKRRNLTSGNKTLWIRGEIAPKEQFLPFSTIFSVYIF